MKLTILKENFKNGLNIVERVTSKSISLPILQNTLLSTLKNLLNFSSTDLELGVNYWSLAKIEEEGKIVVPARLLSNLINSLKGEKINLSTKNNILEIESENFKAQLKGFSPEDFPIIPKIDSETFIEIDCPSFCQGLSQVVDFVTPSQIRPEISGVYFNFQTERILLAATDSFRLAEKTLFIEKSTSFEKEYSFILPQKAARELINIFSEKEGMLKIYFAPTQVLFDFPFTEISHPQLQLTSRLIEGDYPSYQEIIPKKYETQIVLSKNDFLNQIKAASLFSGKINEIKIKANPKLENIEIFSQNPELGESKSSLSGKIEGKEVETAFNYRFLLDGISNIKTKDLILELNKEEGPAVLKGVGDQSYLYVVMPIKAA